MIDSGMKNQHEKYPGLPIFCLYTILSTLFHISCSGHCLFDKHEVLEVSLDRSGYCVKDESFAVAVKEC